LLHNPTAGNERYTREALLALLAEAGYDPAYQSTKGKGFASALEEPAALVVVAGGDGAVGKVAKRLAGRGIPIAILPLGTANNIAKSLGVSGSPRELVAAWRSARRQKVHIGCVRGPRAETPFIEGVGLGLFPWTMRRIRATEPSRRQRDDGRERMDLAIRELKEILRGSSARRWRVILDGEDLSGEYLAVEAMNISCIGPNLALAPGADPGDDLLDVVLVGSRDREELSDYLSRRLSGPASPPKLPVHRSRSVRLTWDPLAVHVDDDIDPEASPVSATVDVRLEGDTVEFLVPSTTQSRGILP
jgi:diacylglycerol kinase (ATP)